MAYFLSYTRFSIGSESPDSNVCNRDRDLSLACRSVPKMGTVAIWERDLNWDLNPCSGKSSA